MNEQKMKDQEAMQCLVNEHYSVANKIGSLQIETKYCNNSERTRILEKQLDYLISYGEILMLRIEEGIY